ncbi:amidohydrolase family protein [Microbacterium sp. M1A1_1b]
MILDAHHHLWDPADRDYAWMDDSVAPIRRRFDVDDLRAAVDGTDVQATIAVQAVHDPAETAWLLSQPAPVAGVVGWVDLTAPDVVEQLAALVDLERPGGPRLVGIRHLAHDEPDRDWLARDDVIAGVRVLAAAGMPFDLLVRDREHAAAVTLVDAVPDGVFVLDHAGKPDIAHDDTDVRIAWRARMDDLAARPNVLCKVSGLVTEAGADWRDRPVAHYARQVVEAFGPDRSLFGSDWPVSTLQGEYAEVLRTATDALADLSDGERDAVFHRTAERVYLAAVPPQT